MKKLVKKYNDFINESLTKRPILSDNTVKELIENKNREEIINLREDFYENILSMTDFFPGFFSDMCKKTKANPESDYKEMQGLLDKKGWDFNSIKNLFTSEVNEITRQDFSEWFNRSRLDSVNGHCDAYLFFTAKNLGLDENLISLGGDGWASYNEEDELWIRYSYGYHQTKYGQLMLKQIGYTVEKFKSEALVYLQEYIKTNWDISLINSVERVLAIQSGGKKYPLSTPLKSLLQSLDIRKYTLVEEDRMIIFTNEISSLINKENLAKVESEKLANELVKTFNWIDIDMQVVDGDVIIWGKFKVDF